MGNGRKFQRKKPRKKGGKATSCHMHLRAPGTSCTGGLQCIWSANHNPALRGSVKMARALILSFLSPSTPTTCHRLTGREHLLFALQSIRGCCLWLFWRRQKGKKRAFLTGFPLTATFLLSSRLLWACLQNQLVHTSFAATPGNERLPSRKDCPRRETVTTSIRAGY